MKLIQHFLMVGDDCLAQRGDVCTHALMNFKVTGAKENIKKTRKKMLDFCKMSSIPTFDLTNGLVIALPLECMIRS